MNAHLLGGEVGVSVRMLKKGLIEQNIALIYASYPL